jgi:hypothetical protein
MPKDQADRNCRRQRLPKPETLQKNADKRIKELDGIWAGTTNKKGLFTKNSLFFGDYSKVTSLGEKRNEINEQIGRQLLIFGVQCKKDICCCTAAYSYFIFLVRRNVYETVG